MQAKNEILEELRLLSAVVNEISRETPYGVPAGYFDDFPAFMLSLTSEAGAEGPFFAKENDKPLTFSVPEGYFEGFAQGLLDKIKAGQTGSNAGSNVHPNVGPNVDSNVDSNVLGPEWPRPEGVKEELARLSPLLDGISRKVPYQAPEGYFEELSPMSPIVLAILAEVREKPLYTVPEGYFAGLAADILSKLDLHKVSEPAPVISAPVISMDRSSSLMILRQRSWWKYSAAAVVAGLIFTMGWLRLHIPKGGNHPAPAADIAHNLVKISDQDLQSYLEQNDQSLVADEQSLTTSTEPVNNTATLDITDSDVKSLLGDVPDGELKSYMEEHGGANDIATN